MTPEKKAFLHEKYEGMLRLNGSVIRYGIQSLRYVFL